VGSLERLRDAVWEPEAATPELRCCGIGGARVQESFFWGRINGREEKNEDNTHGEINGDVSPSS
jgi:hypothetical protein